MTPPKKRRNSRAKTSPGQMELPVDGVQFPAIISNVASVYPPEMIEDERITDFVPEPPRRARQRRTPERVEEMPEPMAPAEGEEMGDEERTAPEPKVRPKRTRKRNQRRSSRRWWHPYWNLLVGFWFVPFAWIFTDAFLQTLGRAMTGNSGLPFWMKHEFLMFSLGAALWFIWLFYCVWRWREPRPIYLYVLGHELTHAVVATLFFGKVNRFKATSDGGYIETNRYNFLIALAPYLWPFYSVPVLAAWALSLLVPGMLHYREWFLVGLGFTWMFHLTFTVWMMPKGQTDFRGPGLLFSFTLIYTVNVILLTGALVSLAPDVAWRGYFAQLLQSGVNFYGAVLDAGTALVTGIGRMVSLVLP